VHGFPIGKAAIDWLMPRAAELESIGGEIWGSRHAAVLCQFLSQLPRLRALHIGLLGEEPMSLPEALATTPHLTELGVTFGPACTEADFAALAQLPFAACVFRSPSATPRCLLWPA
jgi:hypothetical protein